jgi:hypothetical protein
LALIGFAYTQELDLVTAVSFVYPALREGEGREERASAHVPMYHIYQRCLSRTHSHLMLPCNPQMSGTGSLGPKCSRDKKMVKEQAPGMAENAAHFGRPEFHKIK